jgi:hypothetical protein
MVLQLPKRQLLIHTAVRARQVHESHSKDPVFGWHAFAHIQQVPQYEQRVGQAPA